MNSDIKNPPRITHIMRTVINSSLLFSCLAFGSASQANIIFQFDYGSNSGTGFWDPTDGASRQAALSTVANEFSSMFGSHFSNSGTILLAASATNLPESSGLASAGSQFIGYGVAGFTAAEVVKTKLRGGSDLNGAAADGTIEVNFGQPWQLDLSMPVSNTQYDFYSTIYHELTHAIGFSSNIDQSGNPVFGTKAAGEWGAFDRFLVDKDGNTVVNTDFSLNQGVWDAASVGGASPAAGMFFNGAYAVAANGGAAVGLYTPTTWNEGSSVSHLDTDNPALAKMMMTHTSLTGPGARDYSAIEVGMMRDLGYTVTAVPEPEIYAMMFAGLGMVGWFVRRRKA